MAEEITYIPYGQDEISQQDLMTSLANGVPGYLDSKRWAKKDKYRQAWLNAYQDIMGHGLLGASNNSGLWNVQYGQDPIDLSTKSNIEREMYQDAAFYIQQQMSQMPLRKKEEEKKKEGLEQYNFTKQFLPQIYNNRYGGNQDLFASEWENLDERNDQGLRGTDNRKLALIEELNKYKQNLIDNKGKYNFEGTAFKDEDDVIRRIDEAVAAIQSPDLTDDNPKLNALGLSYNSFFSNGGNDVYGTVDGKQVTYQQYYEALGKQKEDEAKAKEEELKKKKQATYNNTLFFNRVTNPKMFGQNPTALKNKYKDTNSLVAALQAYSQKDIRTLTPDEQSEVQGAYRYLANQPIDNTTLKNLQSSSSGLYKGAAPNRFRKIKGIDNLIWDSIANQVIQINSRQQQETFQNQPEDLFANIKTQEELQNIPRGNGVELTAADKRDIYATLADLGAFVNPEVFSGTAMALSASGARTWNNIEQNGLWDTLTDWKTWADWGTGALGGTMLLGDTSSVVKFVRGLGKLMTIPALISAYNNIPEAKAALSKIDFNNPVESAKKLTPQDYHALSSVLVGALSGKNYIKGNLAERKVLQESGFNTQSKSKVREYANKFGITRTKPTEQPKQTETPTLKIKKVGEDGKVDEKEIKITKEQQEILRKTKPSELDAKAKELKIKLPEGYTIKTNTGKVKSAYNSAKSIIGRGNSEAFGKTTTSTQETTRQDNFENWLNNRSTWDQYKPWSLGTNSNLRKIHDRIAKPAEVVNTKQDTEKASDNTKNQETSKTTDTPKLESKKTKKVSKEQVSKMREKMNEKSSFKELRNFRNSRENSSLEIKPGEIKIGDITLKVGKKASEKVSGNKDKVKKLREAYRKKIEKQLSNISQKSDLKTIREALNKAKKLGWWKQGGTINPSLDTIIEDFFKNNNI